MIYDNIQNIDSYQGLSADIYTGLCFLRDVKPDVELGTHIINDNVKAIVSEYETKAENPSGLEAHQDYLDIQYLVSGVELIMVAPIAELKETKSYDKEGDYALYVPTENTIHSSDVVLGNGFFSILFPQDGHMPQLAYKNKTMVKKVVVKVRIKQ